MNNLKFVMSGLMFATMASASQLPNPLLVKSVSAGWTPQEYRTSTKCEIYTDKLVVTRFAGGLTSRVESKLSLDGDVAKVIDDAKLGTVTSKPAPTDGPITSWYGVKTVGAGAPENVMLRQRGSSIRDNDAKAATILVNFLELNCK